MAGQAGSGYLDPTRPARVWTRPDVFVNIPDPTQPDPTRGSTRPGNNSDLMSARLPYPHNGPLTLTYFAWVIFRNIPEYCDVFYYRACERMLRNIAEYSEIFRNIPEYSGILRNIAEYSGILRNIPEYSGIFRNIPDMQSNWSRPCWNQLFKR